MTARSELKSVVAYCRQPHVAERIRRIVQANRAKKAVKEFSEANVTVDERKRRMDETLDRLKREYVEFTTPKARRKGLQDLLN